MSAVEIGIRWENAKLLADQVVRELLQPSATRGHSRNIGLKCNPVVVNAVIQILEKHPGVFIYMEWGTGEDTTISVMKKTDLRRSIKKHDILVAMTEAREFRDEQELPELRSTLEVVAASWDGKDKLADSARLALFGKGAVAEIASRPPDPPPPELAEDGPESMAELRKHLGLDPGVKPGAAERVSSDRASAKALLDGLVTLHGRAELLVRVFSQAGAPDRLNRAATLLERISLARATAADDFELLCTKSVETETAPLFEAIALKSSAGREAFETLELESSEFLRTLAARGDGT